MISSFKCPTHENWVKMLEEVSKPEFRDFDAEKFITGNWTIEEYKELLNVRAKDKKTSTDKNSS